MKNRPKITSVEVSQFEIQVKDIGREPNVPGANYKPGSTSAMGVFAIRIFTNLGITGEYIPIGPLYADYGELKLIARALIGRNPLAREEIYNFNKLVTRAHGRAGIGQINNALWDLAGKFYEAPVHELLGTYRTSFPCYASTFHGDSHPGSLSSPEAYADFAQQCLEMGYPGFKIHPWHDGPVERVVATVHAVGKRVGGKMDLMIDPFCSLRTFGDALKVGHACDEENFFWWEDPMMDGGVSAYAHRKLRQLVKTPLLQLEHHRGLEPHVDFIVAEGTDYVRADPDYDGGVTAVMKIAHAAEGFGLDIEMHAPGPVRRQIMAAVRNSNYYEMALVHPKATNPAAFLPYKDGYRDALDAIDKNGRLSVPEGPGMGVEYDWDYIARHTTDRAVYE